MRCPALNPHENQSACPERILSLTTREEIARCRLCERGQAILASRPHGFPILPLDLPNPEPIEEIMSPTKPKKQWSARMIAESLGLPTNYVYRAKTLKSEPVPGTNNHKIISFMREQGIWWDDLVSFASDPVPQEAPKRERQVPETSAHQPLPDPTPETSEAAPEPEGVSVAEDAPMSVPHVAENEPKTSAQEAEIECSQAVYEPQMAVSKPEEFSLVELVEAVRAKLPVGTTLTIAA